MNNLITLILLLLCSLIVVFVLFKFLKSDASKTNKGYRLRGAAAGFVVIFGFVMAAYTQLAKEDTIPISQHKATIEELMLEKWTITGDIEIEGDPTGQITAVYHPPKPILYIDKDTDKFTLSDVLICGKRFPKIIFRCKDYYSFSLEIDKDNDHIDGNSSTVYIKKLIVLEKRSGN